MMMMIMTMSMTMKMTMTITTMMMMVVVMMMMVIKILTIITIIIKIVIQTIIIIVIIIIIIVIIIIVIIIMIIIIHPTLLSLKSKFLVGHMDNITIDGFVTSEASDMNVIIDDGSAKGMQLNVAKRELISNDVSPTMVPLDQFIHVKPDAATLLGAPLLAGKALDKALEKKYDEFKRASERLQLITSHDALVLLKSSCSSDAHPSFFTSR